MTQPTPGLAEFLLQRIAEDERIVRYASVNAHRPSLHLDTNGYPVIDPARVLAECEAKRRIVERWQKIDDTLENPPQGFNFHTGDAVWAELTDVLRSLAAPYSDHPDFDAGWAV